MISRIDFDQYAITESIVTRLCMVVSTGTNPHRQLPLGSDQSAKVASSILVNGG